MEAIFHEKQEGSLCAQHCVNALLQGSYFTAVDLADIAKQLDETERATMAEAGVNTEEYQRFLQQPSSNFDDSGFFSIQVLQKALRVWNLDLLPLTHSNDIARKARDDPKSQQGYICNFREHWLTVRKLGNQWFNLNSLLTGPELISDTYLAMFLKQLQTEGYSLFIVLGQLPQCEADELLKLCPAVQPIKPKLISQPKKESTSGEQADPELEMALKESRELIDSNDTALQQALKMSLQGYVIEPDSGGGAVGGTVPGGTTSSSAHVTNSDATSNDVKANPVTPSAEEVRKKRLAFLDKASSSQTDESNTDAKPTDSQENSAQETASNAKNDIEELSEEEMLKKALEMSMQ